MIGVILFLLLLLIGVPIAFVLGFSSVAYTYIVENTGLLNSLPQRLYNGLQNFGLLAIPMFVLVGEIMNSGGITKRLIHFSKSIIGHVRGGLAYVNVVANMFLASIIGSATAQTAIMSRIMVPQMEKSGYERSFSTALTASSSILGPLIPPSMPLILYGVFAGAPIGSLFIAGILPGILYMITFCVMIYIISVRKDFPRSDWAGWKQVIKGTLEIIPALAIPVTIIWGIASGVFTATESASIAVFIAVVVGMFIYRELKLKDFYRIFKNTIMTTATVTFLIAVSNIFTWVITFERIPHLITESFMNIADSPFMFLLLVNVLLLVIGMFIDGVAALILLVPILMPLVAHYGVDPIHFGVILTINLTIGLLTPPVGSVLFLASSLGEVRVERLFITLIPFLAVSIGLLLVITYTPAIALSLLKLF